MRFTFNNGKSNLILQAGQVTNLSGSQIINGIDNNLYIKITVLPNDLSKPYYIQQIKAGSTVFGVNEVLTAPNYAKELNTWISYDQFECGIIAHTDGSNILRSIDFIICNFDQSLDSKFNLSVNVTPCSANCLDFDPTKELII